MKARIGVILVILLATVAATGLAQTNKIPPSTNPANHAIFPAKGQDENKQMEDQLAAYRWATKQTGWDPYEAYDVLAQKGYVAAQTAEQAQGGLIKGGARGALGGLAIGAIAGDAGKGAAIGAVAGGMTGGMRSRRQTDAAEDQADAAIKEFNDGMAQWDKNYIAAMEGYGYTVK